MLAAALAGEETVPDIARFGRAKLALLRRFRPFANGTPSHDQLGIILANAIAPMIRKHWMIENGLHCQATFPFCR